MRYAYHVAAFNSDDGRMMSTQWTECEERISAFTVAAWTPHDGGLVMVIRRLEATTGQIRYSATAFIGGWHATVSEALYAFVERDIARPWQYTPPTVRAALKNR